MQFNTTQYYLISPISRVEEFIEELENYRQINKDLPSQNSKQAVFIIILSKIKKKKRKILSNVCNPVFHSVKVASPLAKLYHPLYSSDETVTLVLHSIPTTVSSRSRLINQRTTRAIREIVGGLVDVTRARTHTEIGSYRFVSIGGQTRIDPARDSETPPRIGVWGLATALFASNVAIKYP